MTSATDDQARTYPPGVTSWVDTTQPDVDAAVAFYGGLFGWACTDVLPAGAPGRYMIATLRGRDVAGIGSGDAGWHTYVAVTDTDATAERATELGAALLEAPEDAGPGGRDAVLRDPQGAEFRLWQARRRLGAQLTNAPGTWNFSDLHTPDPARAAEFYRAVFGWRVVDSGWATAIQVPGYGDHLESTIDPDIRTRQAQAPEGFADVIGSVVPLAEGGEPHWHVTFTVADRDDAAALAERLGGTVLASAENDWTRTATVRDPQGAVFTASQFAPTTTSWD